MKSLFFLILAVLLVHVEKSQASTFSFDSDTNQWGSWGTGFGIHDSQIGHTNDGSIWLSTDWGENQTIHYNWSKLTPGIYKITAYVRAQDVQAHPDGSSFWHFFDGGKGTENVFLALNGSYDWRKIEYTLKVQKNNLSIWFRLKSPGQVWIDDVTVVPVTSILPSVSISPPVPLKRTERPSVIKKEKYATHTLLDFDQAVRSHPFSAITNANGNKMGKFSSQKYYNFEPSSYLNGNWSDYDLIELDVFNGNKDFVDFYLTLGDERSNNYWSQLNHKTHLAPGWNHLNFSLTQFLGERGSHRFLRSINRGKIKKIFLVADPNNKFKASHDNFVDNIKLTRNPSPVPPQGIYAIDFTSQKDSDNSGFKKITSQHLYNPERGAGFIGPRFWRVEDSQWASNSLRYSIGVLGGEFKMKLPNGKYKMQLIIDRLGYWDPSFWKDRTLYINDSPIFKESRPYAKDYIKDLLQFSEIVPTLKDHPYDLYLKKIFRPLEFSFTVANGEMTLKFEGDATGISLNQLVIWKTDAEKQASEFLQGLEARSRLEFDWMTRPMITNPGTNIKHREIATLIDPSLVLTSTDVRPPAGKMINVQGGYGEKLHQFIQLTSEAGVQWRLSDLVSKSGAKIPGEALEIFDVIPQYISPDLNHETYMLAGKYLKRNFKNKIEMENGHSRYLYLSFKIKTGIAPGDYAGKITFSSKRQATEIPVLIKVMPYELPEVDFPVGFFGPDPIPFSYYNDPNFHIFRAEARHKALQFLGDAGFTTFSGLPGIKISTDEEPWVLDTRAVDEILTAANLAGMSKVYFSYGGKFPQQFFDGSMIPHGVSEQEFFKKVSPLLNKYLNRAGMPAIVHTFSDEAGGYTDRVNEDVNLAIKIKSAFPFLSLGGFGSQSDTATKQLRSFFDYGFYSNVSKNQIKGMAPKTKWGSYNASPGNLDDPRFSFGPGLFFSRQQGLSHYLEWHASSVNNYPYYDLDGRESDVTMFMPSSDGNIHPTLRLVLAVEGIQTFRKLKLLQESVQNGKGPKEAREKASIWLKSLTSGVWSSSDNILKPSTAFDFKLFHAELNKHLETLFSF